MYKRFFGFREKPFNLVPDPAYLYMSRSHEEAMAHLAYAVSQGDGFVQITGEVGTGKTTLCRAFLENLDDKTEAAYVFNPKLDSILVYPDTYVVNEPYSAGGLPGEPSVRLGESWSTGAVVLSWNSVKRGAENFRDGRT